MLNNALHYVVFVLTLVEMQHDPRIDLDPILAFPCIVFLRVVVKKSPTLIVINLSFNELTQHKVLHHFMNRP